MRGGRDGGGGQAAGGDSLAAAMAELDMDRYDDSDEELGGPRVLGAGNPGGRPRLLLSLALLAAGYAFGSPWLYAVLLCRLNDRLPG
jgi:hypothetical protein